MSPVAALAPERASAKGGRISREGAEPARLHAFDLRGLQQRGGNRATGQFIQAMARAPMIQRCACGGTCDSCKKHDEERETLQRARAAGVQTRLTINTIGDRYEVEADQVADRVMRMAEPSTSAPRGDNGALPASHVSGSAPFSEAPGIVQRALRHGGRPLDSQTRSFMEARFGRQFAGVRVHDDAVSSESAAAIGALAYTVGNHVVFGSGRYAPETHSGRRLLAHELAHVVQQGAAPAPDSRTSAAPVVGTHLTAAPPTVMRTAEECLRECQREFRRCLARTMVPGECMAERQRCMSECPPLSTQEEEARQRARSERLRREGDEYGFTMAEAAVSVAVHNDEPYGGEWDYVPSYRRPFIEFAAGTEIGPWRVVAAPMPLLLNESDVEAFIEGVNAGVAAHAEIEAFFAPIAEALGVIALALQVRGAMQAGMSIAVAPGPRVVPPPVTGRVVPPPVVGRTVPPLPPPPVAEAPPPAAAPVRPGPPRLVVTRRGSATHTRTRARTTTSSHPRGRSSSRRGGGQALAHAQQEEAAPARPERHLYAVPDPPPEPVAPPVAEPVPRVVEPPPPVVEPQTVVPQTAPRAGPESVGVPGIRPPAVPLPAAVRHLRDSTRRPSSCYPICWPLSFGIAPSMVFIRERTPDRDYEHARQEGLQRRWLREFRDPGFVARDYHVHHILPLFLGGVDDLRVNGVTLPARMHLRGHEILRHQPQVANPPPPLRPLDPDIYSHPPGTMYWLAGYKATRTSRCP